MERATQVPPDIQEVAALWLSGAPASESDLRAARSLTARLASFEGLRPFSSIVQRLIDEVAQQDYSLSKVCQLIGLDPALTSRVLRLASSAAYRGLAPCTSVVQAVVRIGANNVSGLAMAMSAMALFEDLGGLGRRIRDHSVGTAIAARELAVVLGQGAQSSKVFLAGLLHDIGKLLVLQSGDVSYAELVERERAPSSVHLDEQSLWGFDHAMLGAQVLRSWEIPPPIPQLIAAHHQPKGGHGDVSENARALDILRLADVVDWLLAQGCDAHSASVARLAGSPDGFRAGLGPETLASLWEDLSQMREEGLRVFA